MNNRNTTAIRPEFLAAKLAAVRNQELPRFAEHLQSNPELVELLNFIQWKSVQPGGLVAFVDELANCFAANLGTAAMRAIGTPRSGKYSLDELATIWSGFPILIQHELFPVLARAWNQPEANEDDPLATPASDFRQRSDYRLTLILESEKPTKELARYSNSDRRELEAECREAAARLTPEAMNSLCAQHFRAELPGRLVDLCEANADNFDSALSLWCFADPAGALLSFMHQHSERTGAKIADTKVKQHVFEAIDYSVETGIPVMIRGGTGIGKTESISIYAQSRPGKVRIVRQPPGNALTDMLLRVADAIGLTFTPTTPRRVIQDKVTFVLKHCAYFLIWDEFHFVIGDSFNRNSAPVRLNWVRDAVMDAGLSCAFISTPQDFQKRLRKFVSATRYNVDQFLRRVEFWPDLPAEPDEHDLGSVAALHFGQFKESLRLLIVGKVMEHGGGAAGIKAIAELAAFFGRRLGRQQPNWNDVERAAEHYKQGRKEKEVFSGAARGDAPEAPRQRPGKPVARRSQIVCGSDFESKPEPELQPTKMGSRQVDRLVKTAVESGVLA